MWTYEMSANKNCVTFQHCCLSAQITVCSKKCGNQASLDWIEQCFTSPPTQYRLYGRRFLQKTQPTVSKYWRNK